MFKTSTRPWGRLARSCFPRKIRQIYAERHRLYRKELKKVQMSQPNRLIDPDENQGGVYEQTLLCYRRRVMPQRDILAELLLRKVDLRHPNGRRALAVLESLQRQWP
ncbi:uncharacterized protein N7498_001620 [Penicillium cinerascens]|uniref:Uncharacterized protein n=1 Tax=Penicillium cinerascens TaxID=70096 RepID=A0A9W9NA10_9EURO|nr:uncharacterized protein N7498_001620 [Penicillium cinerascens]KAJ5215213.1 hypothetical protein N7498_001620 [Penicillium cinerascens]